MEKKNEIKEVMENYFEDHEKYNKIKHYCLMNSLDLITNVELIDKIKFITCTTPVKPYPFDCSVFDNINHKKDTKIKKYSSYNHKFYEELNKKLVEIAIELGADISDIDLPKTIQEYANKYKESVIKYKKDHEENKKGVGNKGLSIHEKIDHYYENKKEGNNTQKELHDEDEELYN